MGSGIVYKIECNITGFVYIGSTVQTLAKRISCHKFNAKNRNCSSKQIILNADYYSEVLETVQIENDKTLLKQRERHYIETLDTVNVIKRPYVSKEERRILHNLYDSIRYATPEGKEQRRQYCEANKDKIDEKNKEYKINNRESILEKKKQYREKNKVSLAEKHKEYREKNKVSLAVKHKQHYNVNKVSMNEKSKEYCEKNKVSLAEKRKVKNQLKKDLISKI